MTADDVENLERQLVAPDRLPISASKCAKRYGHKPSSWALDIHGKPVLGVCVCGTYVWTRRARV